MTLGLLPWYWQLALSKLEVLLTMCTKFEIKLTNAAEIMAYLFGLCLKVKCKRSWTPSWNFLFDFKSCIWRDPCEKQLGVAFAWMVCASVQFGYVMKNIWYLTSFPDFQGHGSHIGFCHKGKTFKNILSYNLLMMPEQKSWLKLSNASQNYEICLWGTKLPHLGTFVCKMSLVAWRLTCKESKAWFDPQ